jgi:hypothetical protein
MGGPHGWSDVEPTWEVVPKLPMTAQVAGKQEEQLLVEQLTKELEELTASLEP